MAKLTSIDSLSSLFLKVIAPCKEFIYFPCTFPAFTDCPNYQGLSTSHITGCKYLLDIGLISFFRWLLHFLFHLVQHPVR